MQWGEGYIQKGSEGFMMQLNLVWSWNNEVRFACFEKVEEVVAQGDYKGQKS